MNEEPDIPELDEAFTRLSNDAQGTDAMAALRRVEGRKSRTVRLVVLGSLAAAALAVVGVATLTGPESQTVVGGPGAQTLDGTFWELVGGSGPEGEIDIVDGSPITLQIGADFVNGSGGCNTYGGNLEPATDANFVATKIFQKLAGCSDVVGEAERSYMAALRGATTFTRTETELVLTGPATTLTFRSSQPTPRPTPLSMSGLEGTAWVLVEGEGPDGEVPLVDGWPITLVFSETGLGGVAACNDYGANASVNGTAITIEGLGWNDAGCGEAVNASQEAFFGAIQNVEAINLDGDELTLFGEASSLTFGRDVPVPDDELIGRTWLLAQTFQGEALIEAVGQPATLFLEADGTFNGSTGCRTLSGEYSLFGSSVNFTTFSAEGSCLGGELGDQDGLVVTVLGDGFTAEIDGERLTLTSQGNEGLVYSSTDRAPFLPEFEALTITDLAGTQWTLGEGIGPLGEILSSVPITLTIEPDALTGQGPCNTYGFSFDPDPDQFLGEGFVTNTGCNEETAESAYFAALERVTGFSVSGDSLALFGPDTELNFQRNG